MLIHTTTDRIVTQHTDECEKQFLNQFKNALEKADNGNYMVWWTFDTAEYNTLNPDRKALVIA